MRLTPPGAGSTIPAARSEGGLDGRDARSYARSAAPLWWPPSSPGTSSATRSPFRQRSRRRARRGSRTSPCRPSRPTATPRIRTGCPTSSRTSRATGCTARSGRCRRTPSCVSTVYQYDGDGGLRNPFLGQPRGVVGGTMTVNGKPLHVLDPNDASTRSRSPTSASACRTRASPTTPPTSAPSRRARWRRPTTRSSSSSAPASRACIAGSASVPCAGRVDLRAGRANADRRLDERVPWGVMSSRWTIIPSRAGRRRSRSSWPSSPTSWSASRSRRPCHPGPVLELGVQPDRHQQRPCPDPHADRRRRARRSSSTRWCRSASRPAPYRTARPSAATGACRRAGSASPRRS